MFNYSTTLSFPSSDLSEYVYGLCNLPRCIYLHLFITLSLVWGDQVGWMDYLHKTSTAFSHADEEVPMVLESLDTYVSVTHCYI